MSAPFGHEIVPPSIDACKKSVYPLTAQRLALLKDIHKNQHSSCPVIKDDMQSISLFAPLIISAFL